MAKELQNIQKTLQRDTDSIKIEMESLFAESPNTYPNQTKCPTK